MLEEFYLLKNQKQKEFVSKLTPTKIEFLGIKTPIIKDFVKNHDITYSLLDTIRLNEYVEQDILYGLFLNKLGKIKNKTYYEYFLNYSAYLDNWCTCDTFVSNTTFKKKDFDNLTTLVNSLLKGNNIQIRCAIILIKKYYIKEYNFDDIFNIILNIKCGEYYIDMAIAWLLCSMACIDFNYIYMRFNDINNLSSFVYKKLLQKMNDSYLITKEQKEKLKKGI